jgi:cytochrome c553
MGGASSRADNPGMKIPHTVFALLALALVMPATASAGASVRREQQEAARARPDPEHGAELFRQCISCHGSRGEGQENGNTPRLAGQHLEVLIKQLVDYRHGKRWDFRMEEMANQHHLATPQDIADVAGYVSSLEGGPIGVGDGDQVEDGARLFSVRCASCHGADGLGNPAESVPRLAGQHYAYLVRQMYDAVDGRRPTLQRIHPRKIEPLDFQQVRAVADYLSRLR